MVDGLGRLLALADAPQQRQTGQVIENVDDLAVLSLLGRVGEDDEAADAIVHLATAKFTTGVVYALDGGHVAGHHFG